jgi:hypothetical protein
MRRLAAKLAFVHRTLWQRDYTYRWAVLLGPPPIIGVAAAALVLTALPAMWPGASTQTGTSPETGRAPWAQWTRPVQQEGEPFAESTLPLPPRNSIGHFQGLQTGWRSEVHPLTVDATRDANVSGAVLASFTLDQPDIPLQRVVDAGPSTGLFVASAQSFFVVLTPGLYAFSVRLARSGTQSADCVARLNSTRHRMVRNINLNTDSSAVLTYKATQFRLEPGLFKVGVGVGCWRGDRELGAGDLTLMVRTPGEATLRPATADELMRAEP